jgi:hypothetical protein
MKEHHKSKEKTLIRVCHSCLKMNESHKELERCLHCRKSFLPLNYFDKIHGDKNQKWENHFSTSDTLEDEDLIKGLFVLW